MNMMKDIPTDGCNLEIMGYPFYAESISPNEAFRRREYNFNGIVGGTQKVTPGQYLGLDFSVVTHVPIDPDKPHEHHNIFQEMMSKPVDVVFPDMNVSKGFKAIVVVKPEREKINFLKITFDIKEVPGSSSKIPGEGNFTVPAVRTIKPKTSSSRNSNSSNNGSNKGSKRNNNKKGNKRNTTDKKSKSKSK